MSSKFVPMITCWNELPYIKNVLPKFDKVSDEIHILDGNSSDGTREWVESLHNPKVHIYSREFDDCGTHFNYLLQKCPKNDTWIFNCTADELPTDYFFETIRDFLAISEATGIDRIFTFAYHLRGERTMSSELGCQLRIFRNDEINCCFYCDSPHERLAGHFDGNCCSTPNDKFAYVHFKQADKHKIELWKNEYVEKGVYSLWDINRRLQYDTIKLPDNITYTINNELKEHLKWK